MASFGALSAGVSVIDACALPSTSPDDLTLPLALAENLQPPSARELASAPPESSRTQERPLSMIAFYSKPGPNLPASNRASDPYNRVRKILILELLVRSYTGRHEASDGRLVGDSAGGCLWGHFEAG